MIESCAIVRGSVTLNWIYFGPISQKRMDIQNEKKLKVATNFLLYHRKCMNMRRVVPQ